VDEHGESVNCPECVLYWKPARGNTTSGNGQWPCFKMRGIVRQSFRQISLLPVFGPRKMRYAFSTPPPR